MPAQSWGLLALFLALALLFVKPFGLYMANVMEGVPVWPVRVGGALERLIYRLCGVDPAVGLESLSRRVRPGNPGSAALSGRR